MNLKKDWRNNGRVWRENMKGENVIIKVECQKLKTK